jgi:hypothetical protein
MELSITAFNSIYVSTQLGALTELTTQLDSYSVLSSSKTYIMLKLTF